MSFFFDFARAMSAIHGGLGPVVTRRLRERAPGRGNYTHTITYRTSSNAIQWTGSFKPWGFVTRGTRAHPILPRRPGGVLVFQAKDGATVFARRVAHPGNRPNRFPLQVWRETLNEVKPLLKAGARSGLTIRQINPYRARLL